MIDYTRTIKNNGTESPIEFVHGARYHPELSTAQIAREVRKLISQAIQANLLPHMKVSVTSKRNSITARITEASFLYKSHEHIEAKELIERFLLAYQKSEHWVNADYSDANFYGFVEWWVDSQTEKDH